MTSSNERTRGESRSFGLVGRVVVGGLCLLGSLGVDYLYYRQQTSNAHAMLTDCMRPIYAANHDLSAAVDDEGTAEEDKQKNWGKYQPDPKLRPAYIEQCGDQDDFSAHYSFKAVNPGSTGQSEIFADQTGQFPDPSDPSKQITVSFAIRQGAYVSSDVLLDLGNKEHARTKFDEERHNRLPAAVGGLGVGYGVGAAVASYRARRSGG